jgi:hypothetical protein
MPEPAGIELPMIEAFKKFTGYDAMPRPPKHAVPTKRMPNA